jgi:hypothetical protein
MAMDESYRGIDNHKEAARHHEAAARYHLDAIRHLESGNHEKAYESTLKALGHHYLAGQAQIEDVKRHALS